MEWPVAVMTTLDTSNWYWGVLDGVASGVDDHLRHVTGRGGFLMKWSLAVMTTLDTSNWYWGVLDGGVSGGDDHLRHVELVLGGS